MGHERLPYHDISPLAACQGQGVPVDFNGQCLDAGDFPLLPGVLLDFHNKGFDVVTGTGLREGVGTGARDVESHPVERDIVAVTGGHTGLEHGGRALEDPIDDFAFAASGASFLAGDSTAGLALTFLLLGGEEGLLRLVVEALVEASALGHGDALVAAVHETFVADTALLALLRAFQPGVEAAAGLPAVLRADLVVAVCRAWNICHQNQEVR